MLNCDVPKRRRITTTSFGLECAFLPALSIKAWRAGCKRRAWTSFRTCEQLAGQERAGSQDGSVQGQHRGPASITGFLI